MDSNPKDTNEDTAPQLPPILDVLLTPGSSLHPTFLLAVDGAFALLLVVLVSLAIATRGNVHLFALIGIEGALWASIKWYVSYQRYHGQCC